MNILLAVVGALIFALLRLAVLWRQLGPAEFRTFVIRRPEYWLFVGVMVALAAGAAVLIEPTVGEAPVLGISAHAVAAQLYGAKSDRPHFGKTDRPLPGPSVKKLAA